jgi:hypothetical protein
MERVRAGGDLAAKVGGRTHKGRWHSPYWARLESWARVWSWVAVPGDLEVLEFEEKGNWYAVPAGCGLMVAVLRAPHLDATAGNILVVTREAVGEERKVHHRFPVVVRLAA